MLQEKIKALAAAYKNEHIAIRNHLHANPELSFNEFEKGIKIYSCGQLSI